MQAINNIGQLLLEIFVTLYFLHFQVRCFNCPTKLLRIVQIAMSFFEQEQFYPVDIKVIQPTLMWILVLSVGLRLAG